MKDKIKLKKKSKILTEFSDFINRGNVMDLAVGVIIGGAFQTVISSLVEDVIMPFISLFIGGIDFSEWKLVLGEGEKAASINYGSFITGVINFLLLAMVVFLIVKLLGKLRRPKEEPAQEVTTKSCPYCLSDIPLAASKCSHCTSDLEIE